MKKSMQATGLYTLSGNTCTDWELQSYASVLDPLCDDLKKLRGESFAATAVDYGLCYRELALGILWPDETAEGRRKTIDALGAVGPDDCSKAALQKLLAALGVTAEATEDLPNKKLTIHITKEPYGGTDAWQQIIGRFLPAHIETVWDYTGFSADA